MSIINIDFIFLVRKKNTNSQTPWKPNNNQLIEKLSIKKEKIWSKQNHLQILMFFSIKIFFWLIK